MVSFPGFATRTVRNATIATLMLAVLWAFPGSQAQLASVQGIYSCTDARGHKLTSDRPIPECADREQTILNPSGTVRAKVGPTLTAQERIALETRERAEQEERNRINEEKRRDRALLMRYPSKSVHDHERDEALSQIRVVREASRHGLQELLKQRTVIDTEMEFYKKDPGKAPPSVRRQLDEVNKSISAQVSFIAEQDAELKRVNARFDEELLRLNQLWATQSLTPATPASKSH